MKSIKTVAVAGAGTMGLGIAQVLAQSGYTTLLFDLSESQLQRAKVEIEKNLSVAVSKNKLTEEERTKTLSLLTFTTSLLDIKADLVIEAIVEKLEIKQQLFQQLVGMNSPDTIFASNTSSISITKIAAAIPQPQRVAGLHFFNPAHLMKLVEVIRAAETSDDVVESLQALCKKLGKTTVLCKDAPGFIVNRVARHYYVESLQALEEQVASQENMDALMESAGFKMGPFKLMDTICNDVNFAVTSSLFEAFHQDAKFRPSRIQEAKVNAGHLGKKTGKGFYSY